MNIDISALTVGTVSVLALVLGITQAVKDIFNLEGSKVKIVSLGTALVVGGVAIALEQGFFSESLTPYIKWIFYTLAFGLSAIGGYDFVTRKLPEKFLR